MIINSLIKVHIISKAYKMKQSKKRKLKIVTINCCFKIMEIINSDFWGPMTGSVKKQ